MDLKQLHTFLTLCEIKNFTKTADALDYAQSSITAQIQQLEAELNTKLFERIGKKINLTPQGEQLIPYAKQILSLSHIMKERLNENTFSGSLTIGAAESMALYRLPPVLKAFKTLFPEVGLYLKLLNSNEFIPMLINGTIDIALTLGNKIQHSAIISKSAIAEPICILASSLHPLVQNAPIQLSELVNIPIILTPYGCHYRHAFEEAMKHSTVMPKVVLETGSIQVIKETTLAHLGISVLPEIAVKNELENHQLTVLNYVPASIYSELLYHKDKWLSPLLTHFINVYEEML